MSSVERLLDQASAPLIKALEEIESEIATVEMSLQELRGDRQKLTVVLRRIAPEAVPAARPKREKGNVPDRPSTEVINSLADFLQANASELNGNGGFHVTGLVRDYDVSDIGNQSTLSRAIYHLREAGILVLDRTGTGGSKFYKVVV